MGAIVEKTGIAVLLFLGGFGALKAAEARESAASPSPAIHARPLRDPALTAFAMLEQPSGGAQGAEAKTPETGVRPDGPGTGVQQLTLSPAKALEAAERLYEAGELDAARAILIELKKAEAGGIDQTQVAFLLGMIAVGQEDYKGAAEIFRNILDQRPDLVRVRLELARALFALKHDQAAAYHFRFALADDLPPEALANIRMFLNLIEQRKLWRVNVSAGVAPDSNVSGGPKDQTIELFGLPFELDDKARERSGLGLSSSLNAEFYPRLSEHWRAEMRGGGSVSDYENIDFDDVFLFAEAGPRYERPGMGVSILGTFSRRYFGGQGYSRSVGGRIAIDKGLTSRMRASLRFSGALARYDAFADRDGPVYSAGILGAYALSRQSSMRAGLTVTREQAGAELLRNTQYLLNGSYSRELPFGVTAQIGPDFYYRQFDAFNPADDATRRDWTLGGSVYLTKRDWRFAGFAPVISYQYLHNDSNVERFDYSRHRANISLTRTF